MKKKEDLIEYIYDMNLQNLTEKISFDRAFKTGIEDTIEDLIELNLLTIPVVIDTLVCDITKGTRCKDSFPNYRDGICYKCGGQAN